MPKGIWVPARASLAGSFVFPAYANKTMVEQTQNKKFSLWWLLWGVIGIVLFFGIINVLKGNYLRPEINTSPHIIAEQVFDIPLLIEKDIEEIQELLGPPLYSSEPTATQIEIGATSEDRTWTKGDYTLSAQYDIHTGAVSEFFLGTDNDRSLEVFRETENILKVGGLSPASDQYSLEFVRLKAVLGKSKTETPGGYTGVIIKPR